MTILSLPLYSLYGQNYAEIGTGLHIEKITWLKWNDPSLADGIDNGDTASFNLPTGEIINVTFANVVFTPVTPGSGNYRPADIMPPWATGTNARAFHPNYNFTSSSDNGMLYSGAVGSNQSGQNITFDIHFSATRNGIAYLPDLVFADSESTNPTFSETMIVSSNGGNWANIEDLQGNNYSVAGFGTNVVTITDTENPQHAPLFLSKASTMLSISIQYPSGDGHAGVTFGVLSPYDLSDAPASYGIAAHFQVFDASAGPNMTNNSTHYLGAMVPDVEIIGASPDALGDDGTTYDDDDAVTIPTLTQGHISSIDVSVNGAGGYLQGWIDYDADGTFDPLDRVANDVQDGGVDDSDGIVNGIIQLAVSVPTTASAGSTFCRFRWSTTSGLDATATAVNGEVEDYMTTIAIDPCDPIASGNTDSDGDGLSDICDIDDDNDGLLDITEVDCSSTSWHIGWNHGIDKEATIMVTDLILTGNDEIYGPGLSGTTVSTLLQLSGITASTLSESIANQEYVEYSFTTKATLTTEFFLSGMVQYQTAPGNFNGHQLAVFSSNDGFTNSSELIRDVTTLDGPQYESYDVSEKVYQFNESTTYTFRVYFYNIPPANSGQASLDDFSLNICAGDFDTDKDGVWNNLDLDSDNDGLFDVLEAGGVDLDIDGIIGTGPITDSDGDGWSDISDPDNGGMILTDPDTDGNGDQDRIDFDSDGDGCTDVIENGFPDLDGDGQLGGLVPPTVDSKGVVTSGGL